MAYVTKASKQNLEVLTVKKNIYQVSITFTMNMYMMYIINFWGFFLHAQNTFILLKSVTLMNKGYFKT